MLFVHQAQPVKRNKQPGNANGVRERSISYRNVFCFFCSSHDRKYEISGSNTPATVANDNNLDPVVQRADDADALDKSLSSG